MKNQHSSCIQAIHNNRFLFLLGLSFFLFALPVILNLFFDKLLTGQWLFLEGSPSYHGGFAVRTLTIIAGSVLLVVSVTRLPFSPTFPQGQYAVFYFIKWGVILLSIFLLALFSISPKYFLLLRREDGVFENLSALFYFATCVVFLTVFIRLRDSQIHSRPIYLAISTLFMLGSFFLGMEEVSWFQRILCMETPGIFKDNMQQEINIHNFATGIIDNVYYFSAYFFFILVPFIQDRTALFLKIKWLSFFLPGRSVLFVSAILATYNYSFWNVPFTQIAFFTTLFMLLYYTYLSFRKEIDPIEKYFLPTLTMVFISTQLNLLVNDTCLLGRYSEREYKEFFIALSVFSFSIEILYRVRAQLMSGNHYHGAVIEQQSTAETRLPLDSDTPTIRTFQSSSVLSRKNEAISEFRNK